MYMKTSKLSSFVNVYRTHVCSCKQLALVPTLKLRSHCELTVDACGGRELQLMLKAALPQAIVLLVVLAVSKGGLILTTLQFLAVTQFGIEDREKGTIQISSPLVDSSGAYFFTQHSFW